MSSNKLIVKESMITEAFPFDVQRRTLLRSIDWVTRNFK